ncbi:MAG: hypothetical protein WA210_15635 [Burkholderiaceae bacterium]
MSGKLIQLCDHPFSNHSWQHDTVALALAQALHCPVQPSDEAFNAREAVVVVGHRPVRSNALTRGQIGEVQMPAIHLIELQHRPDRRCGGRMTFAPIFARPAKGVIRRRVARPEPLAPNLSKLRQILVRGSPFGIDIGRGDVVPMLRRAPCVAAVQGVNRIAVEESLVAGGQQTAQARTCVARRLVCGGAAP